MLNANVLSPMLYQAIENAHLGEIRISNEGMALQWGGISYQNGRRQRSILFWGETYRACCLFCNDTRFRLNINYQYGQPDPLNNNWSMTHLVRCFNEDCSKDPNNLVPWRIGFLVFGIRMQRPGKCVRRRSRRRRPAAWFHRETASSFAICRWRIRLCSIWWWSGDCPRRCYTSTGWGCVSSRITN